MQKCDINEVSLLCNFIDIVLRHGCSPVNLLHIFRTPFLQNTSGWLLLLVISSECFSAQYRLLGKFSLITFSPISALLTQPRKIIKVTFELVHTQIQSSFFGVLREEFNQILII